jgi:hypothetical protein
MLEFTVDWLHCYPQRIDASPGDRFVAPASRIVCVDL